jgi:hypothetical protein
MSVYVVEEGEYSDAQIIAVMSTLELAKAAVTNHATKDGSWQPENWPYVEKWTRYSSSNRRTNTYWCLEDNWRDYTIYEFEIDRMPVTSE